MVKYISILRKKRKAQAWGIDLIIAMIIFSIGIIVFYLYSLNQPGEAEENIESLFYDGEIIADSILSKGYPEDWNSLDVVTIGILSNNKINDTKLERFYSLTLTEYARTKNLFNTKYDYLFFLSGPVMIDSVEVYVGKPGILPGDVQSQSENLIKITRFTIYKDKPVTAYIYVWE